MLSRIYIAISLPALITSIALASQNIVISDGPNTKSSSGHPDIITTDGPAVLPYVYPPKIITTDGPANLAYEYPPKIATTNGPNKFPNGHSPNSKALVFSDGPGTGRLLVTKTHKRKLTRKVVILDAPEPDRSALAPAIPAQDPSNAMPSASNAPTSTLPEQNHNNSFPHTSVIFASIVALSLLAYGSLRAYRRWNSPE